jgi:undecaprenyl-diphosphatase
VLLAAEQRARWTLAAWVSGIAAFVVVNVVAAAAVFDDVADADGIEDLDRPVLEAAVSSRTPTWDAVITVYSYLGGPVVAIVATFLAVAGLSLLWRTWTPFLLMLVAGGGSLAMSMTSKHLVGRERPPQEFSVTPVEPSFSFPAGMRSTRPSSPACWRTSSSAAPARAGSPWWRSRWHWRTPC